MSRMTNAPGAPRRAQATVRRAEALKMRIAGMGYAAIGKQLGVSTTAAYKLVQKAIEEIKERQAEDAEHLRRLEIERLDAAQSAIWPKVEKGDLMAIDRLIRILQRRSAYYGLDAPQKQELSGADGGPVRIVAVDYESAIAAIAPAATGSVPDSVASGEDDSGGGGQEMG